MDTTVLDDERIDIYINSKRLAFIEEIFQEIQNNYFIDLNNAEFKHRFALHVHNLIQRAQYKQYTKNPFTQQVKSTVPLIYDLAVYISNYIQKSESVVINEDEIALIAFHIAGFLETKTSKDDKLTCTLIIPGYYDMQEKLKEKVIKYFGSNIEIKKLCTTLDISTVEIKTDIVMSTIDMPMSVNTDWVTIPPFLSAIDIHHITQRLFALKQKKDALLFKDQINQLIQSYHIPTRQVF